MLMFHKWKTITKPVIFRIDMSEGQSIDDLGICQLGYLTGQEIH